VPFRFATTDARERVAETQRRQAHIDTTPVDVDKKAFNLRLRKVDRELAHSSFKLKSFSTVDRLNDMYEESQKVLDCEITGKFPKKRFSLPQATRKYMKQLEQAPPHAIIVEPDVLKAEKDKLVARMVRNNMKESEINTEEVYKKLQKKMEGKRSKEAPDFGNRNYMLPTYHEKTHFKGAVSLQMQSSPSVLADDFHLRHHFLLN
jgi:hypothetical protein